MRQLTNKFEQLSKDNKLFVEAYTAQQRINQLNAERDRLNRRTAQSIREIDKHIAHLQDVINRYLESVQL